jgi:hypothetical protein
LRIRGKLPAIFAARWRLRPLRRAARRGETCGGDPAIFYRIVNGCWSLFQWGMCLVVIAALAAGSYLYFRLDDEIRRQVEQRLSDHYRHLEIHVGSARYEKERGITIRDVSFIDPKGLDPARPLLEIAELHLAGAIRIEELISGTLPIEEIVVRQPHLHADRRPDGRWDISGLLPMPKFSDRSPTIVIEDATVSLTHFSPDPTRPLSLQNVDAKLTPQPTNPGGGEGGRRYHIVGQAEGLPARELQFQGELGIADGAFDITAGIMGLQVTPELVATGPVSFPSSLAELQFAGQADIALHLTRAAGAAAQVGWSAQGRIQQGHLKHARIPQPMTGVAFVVQADRERLSIEDLTANWGTTRLAAKLNRQGWTGAAPLAVALRLNELEVNQELVPLLPERLARLWARFEPTGRINAALQLTFDGHEWRPQQITADCRGISLTDTEKFPYRVEQAVGRVEYWPADRGAPDRFHLDLAGEGGVHITAQLSHLTTPAADDRISPSGFASSQKADPAESVRIAGYRGRAADSAGPVRPHPIGWIEVTGANAAFDNPALFAALSERFPQGAKLIESLHPRGAFDFDWRAEWKERLQPRADTRFELTLKDCSIVFDGFRYPLRGVSGQITEHNRHWQIHDVRGVGASDGTVVICRGEATPANDLHQVKLAFRANQVPLDHQLRNALPAGAKRAWNDLRPQGNVDFTASVVHEMGASKPEIEVELRPSDRSVSIEPRSFPYRFDEVQGLARYSGGRVDIQEFAARHGRSTYFAREGSWQAAADGGWQLSLSGANVDRLAIDQELFAALPPGLQQILTRLQPRGHFAIYVSTLNFRKNPNVERLFATWDVNLDCHQVSLASGLPLSNITGGIRLAGRADEKGTHTTGELAVHSLTFKDMQFTSVRGPIWADPSECLFGQPADARKGSPQPRSITADVYGGSLTADVRINHEATAPTFRAELALGGADLNRFATERLGGPKDLTGVVSGKLALEGTGNSSQTLLGGGELHVVNANIYELPVLVSMLKMLKNRSPDTTAFNRCDMQFQIQGERVTFQQIKLLGDAVSLYGRGETGFDRKLNMVFYGLAGPADLPIPLWSTIARQATRQMLEIKVDGTWDEPKTQLNPLPTVNNMLEQIQTELGTGAAAAPSVRRDAVAPQRR